MIMFLLFCTFLEVLIWIYSNFHDQSDEVKWTGMTHSFWYSSKINREKVKFNYALGTKLCFVNIKFT